MKETTMPIAIQHLRKEGINQFCKGYPKQTIQQILYYEPGISIVTSTAQISEDRWDYGYDISIKAEKTGKAGVSAPISKSRLPGYRRGWFSSRDDALVYLLYALRTIFKGGDIIPVIDKKIAELMTPSLWQ